jgi:hypothetical protein
MAIKYINIFQSKALQNLPKMGFYWFENKLSGNPASRCGTVVIASAPGRGDRGSNPAHEEENQQ